jgi:hypothetical protein
MVTIDDVEAMVTELPGVIEGSSYGNRSWNVGKQHIVWERPFSKADIRRFGSEPVPGGPIVALRVEDEHEKQAVLASGLPGVFTIPHFDGYPAVLVQLQLVGRRAMRRLVLDAWLAVAPEPLAREHLGREHRARRRDRKSRSAAS